MENAVIYARVSTQGQDYDRQVEELRVYAQRNDYHIVAEFTEKISGAKKVDERNAMSEMLDFVTSNDVKRVLVYECSRISRRAADFLNIIDYLTEHKISLYIHQNGLETLQRDGSVNPIAQLVLGIIGQFNQMERGLIRSRMESGYNHYRSNGGKVGRKVGYKKSDEQMKEEYAEEIRLLKKGISLRNVQKISGTSINTLCLSLEKVDSQKAKRDVRKPNIEKRDVLRRGHPSSLRTGIRRRQGSRDFTHRTHHRMEMVS